MSEDFPNQPNELTTSEATPEEETKLKSREIVHNIHHEVGNLLTPLISLNHLPKETLLNSIKTIKGKIPQSIEVLQKINTELFTQQIYNLAEQLITSLSELSDPLDNGNIETLVDQSEEIAETYEQFISTTNNHLESENAS